MAEALTRSDGPRPTAPDPKRAAPGTRSRPRNIDRPWRWASRLLALSVLVPLTVILGSWLFFEPEVWVHLGGTVLPQLLVNTFWLVSGVALGTLLLGVPLAWLTATCEFPGRRLLDWGLMLPFALPAYVMAFVFVGALDFSGPVQAGLRGLFGLPPAWSFEVRNTFGVILVMTLVLYPYVYMLARVSFLGQGRSAYEAARSLGLGPWAAFFRVSLPMARPGIIAGLSLALMEALADFGAVSVFNFDTFTTAIYKAWFGFFDLQSAAQLASILLTIVLVALVLERRYRDRARFTDTARSGAQRRIRLTGVGALFASLFGWAIFLFAFVLPFIRLASWAWAARGDLDMRYLELFWHTFSLGVMAGLLTVTAAFVLAFAQRYHGDISTAVSVRIGTLGYALPGSVLAVGVMLSLTWFDNRLADAVEWLTRSGYRPGAFWNRGCFADGLFRAFPGGRLRPGRQQPRAHPAEYARRGAQPRSQSVGNRLARLSADAEPRPAYGRPAGAGRRDERDAGDLAAAPVRLGHTGRADLRVDLGG